jgi:AraC-like DNA-binding protein
VRRVLAKARVAASVDWAALAIDAGYYDQAHLAGEVRELTGRTPTEWTAESAKRRAQSEVRRAPSHPEERSVSIATKIRS